MNVLSGLGWWSAGIWLAAIVSFAGAWAGTVFRKDNLRGDLTIFGLVGFGPIGAIVLVAVLGKLFVHADPACTTDECRGDWRPVLVGIVGLIAWTAGLVCGGVHRLVRRRLPRSPAADR